MSGKRLWIVAYDVCLARRWRRLFRLLKSWGSPVQYSIFACRLSDGDLSRLVREIEALIDPLEDRVHVWPVCGQCEPRTRVLGQGGRLEPMPVVWIVGDD